MTEEELKHVTNACIVLGISVALGLVFSSFSFSLSHPGLTQMQTLQAIREWPFWHFFLCALLAGLFVVAWRMLLIKE